jgi:hypothetical protein
MWAPMPMPAVKPGPSSLDAQLPHGLPHRHHAAAHAPARPDKRCADVCSYERPQQAAGGRAGLERRRSRQLVGRGVKGGGDAGGVSL